MAARKAGEVEGAALHNEARAGASEGVGRRAWDGRLQRRNQGWVQRWLRAGSLKRAPKLCRGLDGLRKRN
jgi:hypothetical protein